MANFTMLAKIFGWTVLTLSVIVGVIFGVVLYNSPHLQSQVCPLPTGFGWLCKDFNDQMFEFSLQIKKERLDNSTVECNEITTSGELPCPDWMHSWINIKYQEFAYLLKEGQVYSNETKVAAHGYFNITSNYAVSTITYNFTNFHDPSMISAKSSVYKFMTNGINVTCPPKQCDDPKIQERKQRYELLVKVVGVDASNLTVISGRDANSVTADEEVSAQFQDGYKVKANLRLLEENRQSLCNCLKYKKESNSQDISSSPKHVSLSCWRTLKTRDDIQKFLNPPRCFG